MIWSSLDIIFWCEFSCNSYYVIQRLYSCNIIQSSENIISRITVTAVLALWQHKMACISNNLHFCVSWQTPSQSKSICADSSLTRASLSQSIWSIAEVFSQLNVKAKIQGKEILKTRSKLRSRTRRFFKSMSRSKSKTRQHT